MELYVEVIATVLLESPAKKLPISEVYENIAEDWVDYSLNDNRWKRSVRDILTSNLFVKQLTKRGQPSDWMVHPACLEMYKNGDFRCKEAKRRVYLFEKEMKKKQLTKIGSAMSLCKKHDEQTSVPPQQQQQQKEQKQQQTNINSNNNTNHNIKSRNNNTLIKNNNNKSHNDNNSNDNDNNNDNDNER